MSVGAARAIASAIALVLAIGVGLKGAPTTPDLKYTVHSVEMSPAGEGWTSVKLQMSVTNEQQPIMKVGSADAYGEVDLGSLRGLWQTYTYEGSIAPTTWRWLPLGYTLITTGEIRVPNAAVSDLKLQLIREHRDPVDIQLSGSLPALPPLPTTRGDQLPLGDTFTVGEKLVITPVRFHMGPAPSPYRLMLTLSVKNLTGYDAVGHYRCQIMSGTSCWYVQLNTPRIPPFMEKEVDLEIDALLSAVEETRDASRTLVQRYHLLILGSDSAATFGLFSLTPTLEISPPLAWRTALPGAEEITSFASTGQHIYVGDSKGNLYVLAADSGSLLYQEHFRERIDRLEAAEGSLWCWVSNEAWTQREGYRDEQVWTLYRVDTLRRNLGFGLEAGFGQMVGQLDGASRITGRLAVDVAGVGDESFYLRALEKPESLPGSGESYRFALRIEEYDSRSFTLLKDVRLEERSIGSGTVLGALTVVEGDVAYLADILRWGVPVTIRIRALKWPTMEEIWHHDFDAPSIYWAPSFMKVIDGTLFVELLDEDEANGGTALRDNRVTAVTALDAATGKYKWHAGATSLQGFAMSASADRLFLYAPQDAAGPCIPYELGDGSCTPWTEVETTLHSAKPVGTAGGILFAERDGAIEAIREDPVRVVAAPVAATRHAPTAPEHLMQALSDGTEILPGATIERDDAVTFSARIEDVDADAVRLQVELGPSRAPLAGAQDDLRESGLVPSGSTATCQNVGLVPGESYHWRARAVDQTGLTSEWVEFGSNPSSETDFAIRPQGSQPPTCIALLTDAGGVASITETEVGKRLEISLAGSADDTEIVAARFSSDEVKDGNPTGTWTGWDGWSITSEGWDSVRKARTWSFASAGWKEIWAEIRDSEGNTSQAKVVVFVHPGYAVVVSGYGGWREKSGLDHCANNAYRALRNLGFDDEHIVYLNSVRPQDVDGDGLDEVDAPALLDSFTSSLRGLKTRMGNGAVPLILYFSGHGAPDCFTFDEHDSDRGYLWVSNPTATRGLAELLAEFHALTPVIAMFGSCYSGCFIASTADSPGTISAANRIVITANQDTQTRILWGWARSSDCMWGDLMAGASVGDAFSNRTLPVDRDHMWLDDNGDKTGHAPRSLGDDGRLAGGTRIGTPGSDHLQLTSWIVYWLRSPGELRIYDDVGRVTGMVNGALREEIPDSLYDAEEHAAVLFSPPDAYYCDVVGTDTGTYGLEATSISDGRATTLTATDMMTAPGAVHRYTIDWSKRDEGEHGVLVQIDSDGNGAFEETIGADLNILGSALPVSSGPEGEKAGSHLPITIITLIVGTVAIGVVATWIRIKMRRKRSG
jgi:hypothetical protein